MYVPRYIQYLNLPKIPQEIIDTVIKDAGIHRQHHNASVYGSYTWSDYHTVELNSWCKANIGDDMYYGIQLMTADIDRHTDRGTKIKLNYLIDTGGDDVITNFYDQDQETLIESYQIEPLRWHIFKAESPHEIVNITRTRISITSKIF
jgi:hypothetical protein